MEEVVEVVEEEAVEQQQPTCPICLDFLHVGDEVDHHDPQDTN